MNVSISTFSNIRIRLVTLLFFQLYINNQIYHIQHLQNTLRTPFLMLCSKINATKKTSTYSNNQYHIRFSSDFYCILFRLICQKPHSNMVSAIAIFFGVSSRKDYIELSVPNWVYDKLNFINLNFKYYNHRNLAAYS